MRRTAHLFQRHGDMIHRTNVAGSDRNAVSLIWKEGDIQDGSSALYADAGFEIGARVNQRRPSGISGGAVWKQLRSDDTVWTAEKVFRMVAIPYEYKDQKLLAVPSSLWLSWVLEELAGL